MTDEVVNLRRARKARDRRLREAESGANRARFGRPKADREATQAETARAAARLDACRLEPPSDVRTDSRSGDR
ncbi:MAG TPA: DUF4169 family protein [Methylocystis sp.]|nr:DUF4169 family protein [Methylocystis sp.]